MAKPIRPGSVGGEGREAGCECRDLTRCGPQQSIGGFHRVEAVAPSQPREHLRRNLCTDQAPCEGQRHIHAFRPPPLATAAAHGVPIELGAVPLNQGGDVARWTQSTFELVVIRRVKTEMKEEILW